MKTRINKLAIIAAAMFACNASGERIFSSFNQDGVGSDPPIDPIFQITKPTLISSIDNYHFAGSNAESKNGTIGLRRVVGGVDAEMAGSWSAVSEYYQGRPIYWWVYPNIVLAPGFYKIVDSDHATWSYSTTHYFDYLGYAGPDWRPGVGFTEIHGYSGDFPPPLPPPPPYTQGSGAPWANDLLLGSSDPDNTIAKYGCFLSSVSIILNSYGHHTDPGKLNQFLSLAVPDDDANLAIDAIPASTTYGQTDGIAGIPVGFHTHTFSSSLSRADLTSAIALQIANSGPVLLRVPQAHDGLNHFPAWQHAIVAWEVQGDQIFIRNPGSARSGLSSDRTIDSLTLDDYVKYVNDTVGAPYQIDYEYSFLHGRSYTYASPFTNNTAPTLRGAAHSPVEFVITDNLGRRLGFDPILGVVYNEIPNSIYERLSFIVSPEGTLMPATGIHAPIDFELGIMTEGTYTLDVFGIDSGEWNINLGVNDAGGFNPSQIHFSGLASPSSHSLITFEIPKPSLVLKEVIISPGEHGSPLAISGRVLGGPSNGAARLQASTDLGKLDPWTTIETIALNEFGNCSFVNVQDTRPSADNATSDFFRVAVDP